MTYNLKHSSTNPRHGKAKQHRKTGMGFIMSNNSHNNSTSHSASVGKVRGLLSPTDVISIPGAPNFILGLVELEGRWIPVLDLGNSSSDENRCVVVVENNIDGHQELFGIVSDYIDEASTANDLHPGELEDVPPCFPYTDVVAEVDNTVNQICGLIRFNKALAAAGLDESDLGNA